MKAKNELEVKIPVRLSDEDIEDLMVTAMEGGIGYWACLDNTDARFADAPEDESLAETATKILLDGGGVTFLDNEDRSQAFILRLDLLLEGVRLYLTESYCTQNFEMKNGVARLDMCMVDAEIADMIIQYALFGKLVYG